MVYHFIRKGRYRDMRELPIEQETDRAGGAAVRPHSLWVAGREEVTVRGVVEVQSFDENTVCLVTTRGLLTLEGQGLRVTTLDTEGGVLSVNGLLYGAFYTDDGLADGSSAPRKDRTQRSKLSRLFR